MIAFDQDPWIDIKKEVPPFDQLVLVRGTEHVIRKYIDGWTNKEMIYEGDVHKYALAFNECFSPIINMTQVVETEPNVPIDKQFPPITFEITHWMRIP